jgi:hypothetical protein
MVGALGSEAVSQFEPFGRLRRQPTGAELGPLLLPDGAEFPIIKVAQWQA